MDKYSQLLNLNKDEEQIFISLMDLNNSFNFPKNVNWYIPRYKDLIAKKGSPDYHSSLLIEELIVLSNIIYKVDDFFKNNDLSNLDSESIKKMENFSENIYDSFFQSESSKDIFNNINIVDYYCEYSINHIKDDIDLHFLLNLKFNTALFKTSSFQSELGDKYKKGYFFTFLDMEKIYDDNNPDYFTVLNMPIFYAIDNKEDNFNSLVFNYILSELKTKWDSQKVTDKCLKNILNDLNICFDELNMFDKAVNNNDYIVDFYYPLRYSNNEIESFIRNSKVLSFSNYNLITNTFALPLFQDQITTSYLHNNLKNIEESFSEINLKMNENSFKNYEILLDKYHEVNNDYPFVFLINYMINNEDKLDSKFFNSMYSRYYSIDNPLPAYKPNLDESQFIYNIINVDKVNDLKEANELFIYIFKYGIDITNKIYNQNNDEDLYKQIFVKFLENAVIDIKNQQEKLCFYDENSYKSILCLPAINNDDIEVRKEVLKFSNISMDFIHDDIDRLICDSITLSDKFYLDYIEKLSNSLFKSDNELNNKTVDNKINRIKKKF